MREERVAEIFLSFTKMRVLVIGDVMIDAYYWGNVNRISPEAPVPIIAVNKRENRLGGAANVALNLSALGATPVLCSVVGKDSDGRVMKELLDKRGLSKDGIYESENRITTVKTRLIGNNHQMLRVDSEEDGLLNNIDESAFFDQIKSIVLSGGIDGIIFEDYDKGVLSESLIDRIIQLSVEHSIPTTVDPKKRNFQYYKKCTLFKPNLKELKEGLNIDVEPDSMESIQNGIGKLKKVLGQEMTLLTLSEYGVVIEDKGEYKHFPAFYRDISDVSGAGDTVISVASLCLIAGLAPNLIAQASNLAGGLVCEKVGVVPIEKELLANEMIKIEE